MSFWPQHLWCICCNFAVLGIYLKIQKNDIPEHTIGAGVVVLVGIVVAVLVAVVVAAVVVVDGKVVAVV